MRCLARTVCPDLAPTECPDIDATECAPCVLDARPPKPCGTTTASGGPGVTRTRHGLGPSPGLVRIDYEMYSIPDRLDCYYQGVLVATTGGPVSNSGTLTWAFDPGPADPQWCLVVVTGPLGTAWQYTLYCPT